MKHAPHRRSMRVQRLVLTLFLSAGLWLISGTLMAQEVKVTSLLSNDLAEVSGKEVLMIHRGVSARPFGPYPPPQCACISLRAGGRRRNAGEGRKTNDADARTDLL